MLWVAFILVSLLLPILASGEYLMAESISIGNNSSVIKAFFSKESMVVADA
jgi:hypothetical protein